MPRPLFVGCSYSRGLKEEDEEIQPCYHHHVSAPPPADHLKSHVSCGDHQMKTSNSLPTFSFKGSAKSKSRGTARQHQAKNRNYRKKMARQSWDLEDVSLSPEPLGLSFEFQEPLFKVVNVANNLSDDDDEDWKERYDKVHLPSIARIANMTQYDPYNYNSATVSEMETFSSWPFNDADICIGGPSHVKTTENYATHEEPIEEAEYVSSELSYQELKEENSMLRRKIKRIQNYSESQAQMVRNLERTLQATMNKEEKEAQNLDALMQQTEQNLHCMTQRAVKAESDMEKMKQEMAYLQAELTCYKVENESLRSGQTMNMGAVKQHVDVALQNLLRVTNHAHATINQLVFGAETLVLVADLLKSIGRMSEVEREDKEKKPS